jgi:hypothetical protein
MVRLAFLLFFVPIASFAQLWEFSEAEALNSGINTDFEETLPLLSPDGKTLYFSRILYPQNNGGKYSGSDIWTSSLNRTEGEWSKAVALQRLNDRDNSSVVGVSADGKTLYVMKTDGATKAAGIYFSRRTGTTWSRPELIPISNLEPGGFMGFHASPDFEVIFISMQGADTRGEEDLYVSVKGSDNKWSSPKNLGSSVNSAGYEISPFLSQDKKRLYFASNGHRGIGDADIFYCDRLYESWDTWSAPRNLGEKLNTKFFDGYFSIYGDSIAYFASNRKGRYSDIFRVDVVPGNEVLAYGQRYLTNEETAKLLGADVNRRMIFEGNSTELRAADRELLFYIGNKIKNDRDISIQITVIEENSAEFTDERLKAVADELRLAGIDNIRILVTNNERFKKSNPAQAVLEILFFK